MNNVHYSKATEPCNFTAAETNALLEGVQCHYGTIVGSFNS